MYKTYKIDTVNNFAVFW